MADNPQRLSRSGSRVAVSFEFFPPKTPEMEAQLWEAVGRLAPLSPRLRLGHLRRRRLDPRAHPRDRRAAGQGNAAQARRPSDLRRRELR